MMTPGGDTPIHLSTPPCESTVQSDMLHVVACINNYARWYRRYELFHLFKERMDKEPNIILYVVEVALGDRPFMVTDRCNPRHLQLRTNFELWHKENSINLMVQRFPPGWKYMAWIDADVTFDNKDFVNETIHCLQQFEIVQMFQSVVNRGPDGEVLNTQKGFMFQYLSGAKFPYECGNKYENWHPGFAWACTRRAFDVMGGLIDFAILGAGDHHMALAFIGRSKHSVNGKMHKNYKKLVKAFEKRCERHIKRDVGYVKGIILHDWHGTFEKRRYAGRWVILVDNKFDPVVDIHYDSQGLLYLTADDKLDLRDQIRKYFRDRNEDGIDK